MITFAWTELRGIRLEPPGPVNAAFSHQLVPRLLQYGTPGTRRCRMRMLPVPIASRRANVQLHPRLSLLRYGSGDTKRSARGTTVARLEEAFGFYLFDVWERFQGGTGKSQTSNSCATGRPSFDTRATLQSLICSVLCAGSCSLTSSAVGECHCSLFVNRFLGRRLLNKGAMVC